ncbi:MAG: hypothetical protein IJ109_10555 [Firmicutes bacterium]|nr:hypothetical protein [Bacillota bacterium]MBQ9016537.1 hypothetical protein [Bacillota bacterium]
MDITLIPTKLNGKINARPSVTYSLLHATCQALSLHQVRTGAAQAEASNAARAKDYTRLPGCWSRDLEVVLNCFEALSGDAPTLFCSDDENAFALMLPIAAATKQKVSFTGSGAFPNSTVLPLADALKPRGVSFSRGDLKIKRRDRDRIHEICTLTKRIGYGSFSLTGREDPCFIAGLLLALPLLEGNSSVRMTTMPDSTELPDMAIAVLRQYGVTILRSVDDYGYPFYEIPGNQKLRIPDTVSLEGDWTRAAFWLGCGALGGNVTIRGLSADSRQVCRQILDKLHSLGAATGQATDSANVVSGSLRGCNINASRIPDLVPILSVIMAHASGTSMLTGIDSDAYASVFRVLDAFGADISDGGSGFSFTGRAILTGGEIDASSDPLIVLTATAASCISRMPVTIRNAGVINKTFPGFFEDYAALGGKIER